MYKLVVLFSVALARNSLASVGHAVAPAHLSLPAGTSYLGAPALRVAAPALATSYAAAPAIATSYAAAPAYATRYAASPAIASYAAAPAIASYAAAPAFASYAAAPAVASYAAAPAVASYAAAPAVASYAAAPAIASYAAAPAVTSYAAAPAFASYAAAPAVAVAPAARLATPAQIQTTSYALEKNVHYASKPVVTGYSTSVVKPNFGGLATPHHTVSQQSVLAAGRQVQTITPHVTRVEPEVSVHQVPVDVPVPHPVVSEVEVRTPVVQGAPIVAAPAVAAAPVVAAAPIAPAAIAAAPIAPAAIAAAPIAPAAVAADLPTIVEARAAWSAQHHAPIGARITPGFRLAHY